LVESIAIHVEVESFDLLQDDGREVGDQQRVEQMLVVVAVFRRN